MTQILLPLSFVRSFKLTVADREILRAAAEDMRCTEADVVRYVLRRLGQTDLPPLLSPAGAAACRKAAAGQAIAPPVAMVAAAPPAPSLVADLPDEPAGNGKFEIAPRRLAVTPLE